MVKLTRAFFLVAVCSLCLVLFSQIAWAQKVTKRDDFANGASVFKKVSSSVVVVRGISNSTQMEGSGVAYNHGFNERSKPNLTWVVTNAHVVAGSDNVKVEVAGKTYPAELQYSDSEIDIALLIVRDVVLPITKVAGADVVAIGDRVFAIGSPLGLNNSITDGIVSGLRNFNGVKLIQTSAAISKGNSGGGLFDGNGNLIGITTFKIKDGENLNFAIDAKYLQIVGEALFAAELIDASHKGLMSSALVKWMLKKASPDGDTMYLYVKRVEDEAMNIKDWNDSMDYIIKKFDVIVQQYLAENGSVNKGSSPSQAPSAFNNTVYRLVCPLYVNHNGKFIADQIVTIDQDNSLVDGKPAIYDETTIIFRSKDKDLIYTLNRYSATLTVSSKSSPNFASGKCSKLGERKF